MMILRVALIGICLLALESQARLEIRSDYVMHVPKEFIDSRMPKESVESGTEVFEMDDMDLILEGDLKAKAEGIRIRWNYSLPVPGFGSLGTENYAVEKNLDIVIEVDSVKLEGRVDENGAVIDGSFTIDAECNDLRMVLRDPESELSVLLKSQMLPDGEVYASMPWGKVSWNEERFQWQSFECQGANGFDELVRNEIDKMDFSAAPYEAEVLRTIKSKLLDVTYQLDASLLEERELPGLPEQLEGRIIPSELTVARDGSVNVIGQMLFVYADALPDVQRKWDFNLATSPSVLIDNQVHMSFQTLEAIVEGWFLNPNKLETIIGNENADFVELLGSRTRQRVVWPDLREYEKDDTFRFEVHQDTSGSQFQNWKSYKNGIFQCDASIPLRVETWAPRNGVDVNSVNFGTVVESPMTLRMDEGVVTFELTEPEATPLTAKFNADYLRNFETNTLVVPSFFDPYVPDYVKSQSGEVFRWEAMDMGDGKQLLFDTSSEENGVWKLDFNVIETSTP